MRRPLGQETAFVRGIRLIRAQDAARRGLTGRSFALPFGAKQDGTKLVLDYLEEAKKRGARYVANLRIVLRQRVPSGARGVRACETRLVPFARKRSAVVPTRIAGRTVTRRVPKLETRTVTESRYRCHLVTHPVTRMVTRYTTRYDYATHSSRSVPTTRMVTSYESRNECRTEMVTRVVTRYRYQLQTRYIPPRIAMIRRYFADNDLIETHPVCHPVATSLADARLPHRIVGTIYGKWRR